MGYIYCWVNNTNNKKYIGQSINDDLKQRGIREHQYSATHKTASDYESPLHRAMRKYGIENFTYKILAQEIEDQTLLNQLEIYYIQYYDSQIPNGYNIEKGGKNGEKEPFSQETKEKMRWAKASLTEQEVIELRHAYANHESPQQIYDQKYKDRLDFHAFMNIWGGKRYSNICPELIKTGRHTKLSLEKANAIREDYKTGKYSYVILAKKYGCSKAAIADIINNRTWKNPKK